MRYCGYAQAGTLPASTPILVHPKDDEAKAFCEHFDFEPRPTDPYHLFLLMKDLRQLAK